MNGCRHCGIGERGHGRRWENGIGWHEFVDPTDEQRKERHRAAKETRKDVK